MKNKTWLKAGIFGLIATICIVAFAADEVMRSDKLRLGIAASGVDKVIEFDAGLGAANPKITMDVGDGQLKFSNDGSNFQVFGSGGGGIGVNILLNADFELGSEVNWTASGGTFTVGKAGDAGFTIADIGFGTFSGKYAVAASAQTVTSTQQAIPPGLQGKNCLAQFSWLGGNSNLSIEVIDGAINVLISETLSQASVYKDVNLSFICPSSGTLALRLVSDGLGDPPDIFFDSTKIGDNHLVGRVSQAQLVGSITYAAAAGCTWSGTAGVFTPFVDNGNCSNRVVKGDAVLPSTLRPAIKFNNLPPGNYKVIAQGRMRTGAAGTECGYGIRDNVFGNIEGLAYSKDDADDTGPVIGLFTFESAVPTVEFQMAQVRRAGASVCEIVNSDTATNSEEFSMQVYRYPTQAEIAIRIDQAAWFVDVNIGGANINLLNSTISAYEGMTNSGLDMVLNPGSIATQILCDGVASSGLTCSGGDEQNGIVFTPVTIGRVVACAAFSHGVKAEGVVTFQIVETISGSKTVLSQLGNDRIPSKAADVGNDSTHPIRVCGTFDFPAIGLRHLAVFREQLQLGGGFTTNIVTSNRDSARGQQDIHWTVIPITRNLPMPFTLNHVSTPAPSGLLIVSAKMNLTGGGCSVSAESGDWIASSGRPGIGQCDITPVVGIFNDPSCHCSLSDHSVGTTCIFQNMIAGGISIQLNQHDNALVDEPFSISCRDVK